MADTKETALDPITSLGKKIDEQSRLTRMLIIVCCLSTLASMFYSLASLIGIIPNLVLTKMLANIEPIQMQWHSLEKLSNSKSK
jgi:flagellar biosynthesis protein FlhB